MWLFTRHGFVSAVINRDKRNSVMVRARSHQQLRTVLDAYLPGTEAAIVRTPRHDYPCRAFLSQEQWVALATQAALDVDYDNFKNEAARAGNDDYNRLLHDVWLGAYNLLDDRNQTTIGGDR